MMIEHIHLVVTTLAAGPPPPIPTGIPNPPPDVPAGADKIMTVIGNIRWAAGAALMVGFLMGLVVWAGGRWVDHHRAGRVGVVMMLCSIAGGLLYGIGYQLISQFAQIGP